MALRSLLCSLRDDNCRTISTAPLSQGKALRPTNHALFGRWFELRFGIVGCLRCSRGRADHDDLLLSSLDFISDVVLPDRPDLMSEVTGRVRAGSPVEAQRVRQAKGDMISD